jgi:hypothetical protein
MKLGWRRPNRAVLMKGNHGRGNISTEAGVFQNNKRQLLYFSGRFVTLEM